MSNFTYKSGPIHVVFGFDTLQRLPEILVQQNVKAAIILSTSQQVDLAEKIRNLIGQNAAGVFTNATMHTPTHISQEAIAYSKARNADCVISAGGGSTIGLGKAIAIRTGLMHICIPTTYAGSEMTPILGETEGGLKTTRRDPRILPKIVLYDVNLTMTLPASLSATSGINAIAHAVEALYAADVNPIISLLAIEGTKALSNALPSLASSDNGPDARYSALYGSWLCGICLGNAEMALHHKLCHTLGGSFNLPHAETHTIMLPHTLSYNAPNVPEVMQKLAGAIPGSDGDAIRGLNILLDKIRVKRALKDFGMREEDIDEAARIAISNPYKNPRAIEYKGVRELIRRAWAGETARLEGL